MFKASRFCRRSYLIYPESTLPPVTRETSCIGHGWARHSKNIPHQRGGLRQVQAKGTDAENTYQWNRCVHSRCEIIAWSSPTQPSETIESEVTFPTKSSQNLKQHSHHEPYFHTSLAHSNPQNSNICVKHKKCKQGDPKAATLLFLDTKKRRSLQPSIITQPTEPKPLQEHIIALFWCILAAFGDFPSKEFIPIPAEVRCCEDKAAQQKAIPNLLQRREVLFDMTHLSHCRSATGFFGHVEVLKVLNTTQNFNLSKSSGSSGYTTNWYLELSQAVS